MRRSLVRALTQATDEKREEGKKVARWKETERGPGGQRTRECLGLGLEMKQEDSWQRRMEGQQTGTWLLLVLVLVLVLVLLLVLDLREKQRLVFPVNHALMEYFDIH